MSRVGQHWSLRRPRKRSTTRQPHAAVWRGGAVLLAAAILSACSSSSDSPDGVPSGGAGGGAGASAGSAAPVPSGSPPVIATASGTGALHDASLAVRSLDRTSKETVTLVVTVTNNSSEEIDFLELSSHGDDYKVPSASGATLIDPVGRLRYYPLRDTDGVCVCTPMLAGEGLPAAGRIDLTVSFPAPPTSVRTVTIDWNGFTPTSEVPIS